MLISTAYLPPADYFSLIANAGEVSIESKENYIKQTYRNRCYILSSHGSHLLSVPVIEGSRHKIPITEARIDHSKRWKQVHLRAIVSCYRCSPYFDFYYEPIEKIISADHDLLWDLNMELVKTLLKMLKIRKQIKPTDSFEPPSENPSDYRYRLEPGKNLFDYKKYLQVFSATQGFVPNLSIIDLIFNLGPDAVGYLGENQLFTK
ncbi:MAG TPA: WbqC family protein [Bacteroidales bacterium]|nr:WbqC family protein [Bacteroidales bacterium]